MFARETKAFNDCRKRARGKEEHLEGDDDRIAVAAGGGDDVRRDCCRRCVTRCCNTCGAAAGGDLRGGAQATHGAGDTNTAAICSA